jgi:iron complex outermembrane receptor protein
MAHGTTAPHGALRRRSFRTARESELEMMVRTCALLIALGLLLPGAAAQRSAEGDLDKLNLEQLLNVPFYTASKRSQSASDTPASVTVVTAAEIRTFGYRGLADVLQGVRGFWVNTDRNYSYLGVRGLARPGDYNARILLLINGHRLNDNIYDGNEMGVHSPPLTRQPNRLNMASYDMSLEAMWNRLPR